MRPSARLLQRLFHSRCIAGAGVLLGGFLKAAGALAATLTVAVQTSNGRPLGGAVLTVHALSGPGRPAVPVNAIMDQVDRAFVPDLLVIPPRSTVEFPNSDSVSHQIYSFSAAKKFQLPLYRGKPYPPVRFEQAHVIFGNGHARLSPALVRGWHPLPTCCRPNIAGRIRARCSSPP